MNKHRLLAVLAASTLALAACGSDGDSGSDDAPEATTADENGTDGTVNDDATDDTTPDDTSTDDAQTSSGEGAQAEAADRTVEQAAEQGVTLDADCVNDVTAQLSDEDAEAVASGNDSEVSPEGEELSLQLLECADPDAIADLFIEGMSQSGQEFDEECAREKLDDFDIAEVVAATQGGAPPEDLIAAMVECMDMGGS